jgi:hypothetical protein
MAKVIKNWPTFSTGEITHLCQELADTGTGLSGSEIGYILEQMSVEDIKPTMTKWKRCFNALINHQNKAQNGNIILSFIAKTLEPARYVGMRDFYLQRIVSINVILAFKGLQYKDDGKFHVIEKASSLSEAEARASLLKENLIRRNLHPELIRFCRAELVADNYFHAVLEATKSIAENIRSITGLTSDGAVLIDEAFGGDNPRIRINS